jgi:hypothetical protein
VTIAIWIVSALLFLGGPVAATTVGPPDPTVPPVCQATNVCRLEDNEAF